MVGQLDYHRTRGGGMQICTCAATDPYGREGAPRMQDIAEVLGEDGEESFHRELKLKLETDWPVGF